MSDAKLRAQNAGFDDDPKFRHIRRATSEDLSRVAEIYVFNNRLEYFPVFHNVGFSFGELQVLSYIQELERSGLEHTYVYDDGVVKGFVIVVGGEIQKLHVEHFFQNVGIGSCLLDYAVRVCDAKYLWALEKNERAIGFYERRGMKRSSEKEILYGLNGHTEYIVKMIVGSGEI